MSNKRKIHKVKAAVKKALSSPLFRHKEVQPKKGRGSFRRNKHGKGDH